MKSSLYEILIKKYHSNTLASLYLARYKNDESLALFSNEFVKKISVLDDHPDILWVKLADKEQSYKVDSVGIKSLLKFLNYKAIELKTKLILIQDAHLLSDIVANKLLKTFEEMPNKFCLFLLTPQDQNLLSTVESRALKISLPNPEHLHSADFPFNEQSSLNEILGVIKGSADAHSLEKMFIVSKCEKILSKNQYNECNSILEKLKHYEQSENYNNSKLSRLSLLF